MNGGLHISKKRITTIYPRDRKALSALSRCGYVSHEQLGQFLRSKRIESYCKDDLIVKSVYSQPGSKATDQEVYRLTPKGRDFCRRELSLSRLYSAQNPAHDLALADRYFSLSENERETWQTESQSRDAVSEHIRQLREQGAEERARELWEKLQDGRLSMPDAVYTRSDGVSVAFEVVTNKTMVRQSWKPRNRPQKPSERRLNYRGLERRNRTMTQEQTKQLLCKKHRNLLYIILHYGNGAMLLPQLRAFCLALGLYSNGQAVNRAVRELREAAILTRQTWIDNNSDLILCRKYVYCFFSGKTREEVATPRRPNTMAPYILQARKVDWLLAIIENDGLTTLESVEKYLLSHSCTMFLRLPDLQGYYQRNASILAQASPKNYGAQVEQLKAGTE